MAQAEYRKTQAMNIFLIDCHQDMQKELECVPYKCSVFFHLSSKFWVPGTVRQGSNAWRNAMKWINDDALQAQAVVCTLQVQ
jgi:hypothetical protein